MRKQHSAALQTARDNIELPLSDLHYENPESATSPANPTAPYHLISCAINLAGSRDLTRKDRKSGYFLFSRFFCGSIHTGFMEHSSIATARGLPRMTISGPLPRAA